ncbi:glycosyl hydrolase 108 family protein [Aminobacter sp. J15]|uniref:glycoside hydrolase family 108 protein n=1 Tax=Aminobacter sp. J15 TaxID=935260 RepID=UPI0032B0FC6B
MVQPNKGVTLASFRAYVKPNGSVEDLRAITDTQVATVYYRHYRSAVNAQALPAGIDYAVFDFAVNSGPGRAAQYLQAVLGVSQDGRIGPATIAAAEKADARAVIDALCDNRLAFLKRITNKGKRMWDTFGNGWQRRVTEQARSAVVRREGSRKENRPLVVDHGPVQFRRAWSRLVGWNGLASNRRDRLCRAGVPRRHLPNAPADHRGREGDPGRAGVMFGLRDWLKVAAGAALGAAVMSVPVYLYGKADGRQIERAASLTRSVESLRERNATDDRFATWTTLLSAALLAGCQTSAPALFCDGWRKLSPSADTRNFIIENDQPFAEGVASYNGFGAQRGCW